MRSLHLSQKERKTLTNKEKERKTASDMTNVGFFSLNFQNFNGRLTFFVGGADETEGKELKSERSREFSSIQSNQSGR